MSNDQGKTTRCMSNSNGTINVLHVYGTDTSDRNNSLFFAPSCYYVSSIELLMIVSD